MAVGLADAQGTLEAVRSALSKIEDPIVQIKVVGEGVGVVNDSDVLLASVSSAIIVCFNLKSTPASDKAAEAKSCHSVNARVPNISCERKSSRMRPK